MHTCDIPRKQMSCKHVVGKFLAILSAVFQDQFRRLQSNWSLSCEDTVVHCVTTSYIIYGRRPWHYIYSTVLFSGNKLMKFSSIDNSLIFLRIRNLHSLLHAKQEECPSCKMKVPSYFLFHYQLIIYFSDLKNDWKI